MLRLAFVRKRLARLHQDFEEMKEEATREFILERYNGLCMPGDDEWNDQVWDAVHKAAGVEPAERPREGVEE